MKSSNLASSFNLSFDTKDSAAMRPHINIISRSNGVGLDQDAQLIKNSLEAGGMEVSLSHCRSIPAWSHLIPTKPKFDANIFLERTFSRWFGTSKINLLIPNQERFPARHIKKLKHIHTVLCKSKHAEEIFSQYSRTELIGFTSADRNSTNSAMDFQSYFHLAGKSTLKGTEALLQTWEKHPEWPTLTLIQHKSNAPEQVPANVVLISEYISSEELVQHLNKHGVHLCPSLSEGWGHYIVEAMSCGAVVLTTDAPPMNEIVSASTGTLVPFYKTEPRHLGTNFHVNTSQLESHIEQLMQSSNSSKEAKGKAALAWFEQNDTQFRSQLAKTVSNILNGSL